MTAPACPREKEVRLACSCPKSDCANHSKCCYCIDAHRKSGKPVHCMAGLVGKK